MSNINYEPTMNANKIFLDDPDKLDEEAGSINSSVLEICDEIDAIVNDFNTIFKYCRGDIFGDIEETITEVAAQKTPIVENAQNLCNTLKRTAADKREAIANITALNKNKDTITYHV